MARDPTQRASDAERDEVADRLRTAAAEGRLDPDELDERVGHAYAARTDGELARANEDLPGAARDRHRIGVTVVHMVPRS